MRLESQVQLDFFTPGNRQIKVGTLNAVYPGRTPEAIGNLRDILLSALRTLRLIVRRNPRMNRLLVITIAAVATLFFIACDKTSNLSNSNAGSSPTASATPDAFAATRATYEKDCKECHGATGTGGPVKLTDGTKLKVPSLREGHALRHPDSDFVKQIEKGGDGMPAFKDKLTPQETADLIRFIRQEFQGGRTPPAEPMKPTKNMD